MYKICYYINLNYTCIYSNLLSVTFLSMMMMMMMVYYTHTHIYIYIYIYIYIASAILECVLSIL